MPFPLPELLAPAGSPETLLPALDGGADAVYLGAPDFNARKRAKNFTRGEIEEAAALIQSRGKKIYIALNTLILDREVEALIDLLAFLDRIAVDAVIIQDLGLLDLIRRHFPSLRIHASTQLFCHNSLQAALLKEAGVSRIILPREMTIKEIRAIKEKVPLEYEVFIHGALCFAFSGCCLFSSYLYGASGNRGECRQVCRHAFESEGKSLYPFSMKDLHAGPVLQELLGLGLSSLKIEGRLKNADYVFKTVSMYRSLLDGYAKTGEVGKPGELKGQRTFSPGYFSGGSYETLVESGTQGIVGENVGTAEIRSQGRVLLKPTKPLTKGARLRLMDPKGRVVAEGTLLEYGPVPGKERGALLWELPEARPFDGALRIILLGSTQPKSPHRAMKHALSTGKRRPVRVSIRLGEGQITIINEATDRIPSLHKTHPIDIEAARSDSDPHALRDKIGELFRETGATPFLVERVQADVPDSLFCPMSRLKALRREFFDELSLLSKAKLETREAEQKKSALEDFKTIPEQAGHGGTVTLDYAIAVFDGDPFEGKSPPPGSGQMILLPPFVAEERLPELKFWVKKMVDEGRRSFAAGAYGQIGLLGSDRARAEFISGPYIYCANRFAYRFLKAKGFSGCVLPPDIPDSELGIVPRLPGMVRLRGLPRDYFVTRLKIPDRVYRLRGMDYRPVSRTGYTILRESDRT